MVTERAIYSVSCKLCVQVALAKRRVKGFHGFVAARQVA
jgi:hypothetical protein